VKPFTTIQSRMVPMKIDNVDTDQIIPARFLKTISKVGLGDQLFCDWRYDAQGYPKPDFILNQARSHGAEILLAGDNFGCGSSREHAPWALTQFGFRAVISTSFADIFKQNALKNSLLPVVVPREIHAELFAMLEKDQNVEVTVNLAERKLILADGRAVGFPVDEFARHCLLEGVDELGYILKQETAIAAFEAGRVATINTL
jgi:3-isopropylmalate/(R)-2-methylmalate dehydratase small subunit